MAFEAGHSHEASSNFIRKAAGDTFKRIKSRRTRGSQSVGRNNCIAKNEQRRLAHKTLILGPFSLADSGEKTVEQPLHSERLLLPGHQSKNKANAGSIPVAAIVCIDKDDLNDGILASEQFLEENGLPEEGVYLGVAFQGRGTDIAVEVQNISSCDTPEGSIGMLAVNQLKEDTLMTLGLSVPREELFVEFPGARLLAKDIPRGEIPEKYGPMMSV